MATIGAISRLSPNQLEILLSNGSSGIQLIDVRTPLEFDSEHIQDSKNIPLDDLANRGGEIKKDCTTILICRTGNRAGRAADLLAKYGMDVGILTGGTTDWKKAGLPLKEGQKRLSLERQTQLTIGAILLSSVAAGWSFNRGWFIVPAFIGAGLTFAGLTGNCGLAMLLARAPWNKLDTQEPAPSKPSCCS
jgi:rhodanese-related sulfurtransferase